MRAYAMAQRPSSVRSASTFFFTTSSQELLGQIQPNLAGNMPGGWGCRYVEIKGLAPFGAQ